MGKNHKISKISRSKLNAIVKDQYKTKTIEIKAGNHILPVVIKPNASQVEIVQLIDELKVRAEYANRNNIVSYNPVLDMGVLILKKFTNLPYSRYNELEQEFNNDNIVTLSLMEFETDKENEFGLKENLFNYILNEYFSDLQNKIEKMINQFKAINDNFVKSLDNYNDLLIHNDRGDV